MTTLGWGILGAGRIAPRIARGVAATDRARLVAVASRDAGRARGFADAHGIGTAHGSYEALLDDPSVDVVYVALPNALHAAWTVRALRAGKHVLCEKPLALSAADVDTIADAAHATGRIAVEAFMFLHHPQTLRAVEIARSGLLGPLEAISGSFSFFLTQPGDPRLSRDLGGGSLWDVGCYPVTFAHRVAGEVPAAVEGFARFGPGGAATGIDMTFVGLMRFPGGSIAAFDCGFAAPDRQRLEVVGRDAMLLLDAPFLTAPDGPPPSLVLRRGGAEERIEVETADQYAREVEDLTAAILDGREPRVGLAFSRGSIGTLVALDRAARAHAGPEGGGEDRALDD
jgi:D-xylose 1-dehydrogenase (NADP+, D-xylono-1,5-lactone-forming)